MDDLPPVSATTPLRTLESPAISISSWLEGFARMAAILTSHFLWAYQSTIAKAANSHEEGSWVAYNRKFRRDMLSQRDLNWSVPNSRLHNEAFTGQVKAIPRCPHCLEEDHIATNCPQNPNPLLIGWVQGTPLAHGHAQPQVQLRKTSASQEVIRNFKANRYRFSPCRYIPALVLRVRWHTPCCQLSSSTVSIGGGASSPQPPHTVRVAAGAAAPIPPSTGTPGIDTTLNWHQTAASQHCHRIGFCSCSLTVVGMNTVI